MAKWSEMVGDGSKWFGIVVFLPKTTCARSLAAEVAHLESCNCTVTCIIKIRNVLHSVMYMHCAGTNYTYRSDNRASEETSFPKSSVM